MIVIERDRNEGNKISEHFKASEFICKCGKCPISIVSEKLLERLEILRSLFGEPIIITSGFRCLIHNVAVGGKKYSKHQSGKAVDIAIPNKNKDMLIKMCKILFSYSYVGKSWIHCQLD